MFMDNPHMPLNKEASNNIFLAGTRCHNIGTVPIYALGYVNCNWVCDNKTKYAQYTCKWPGCKKKCAPFVFVPKVCGCASRTLSSTLWTPLKMS